MIVAPKIVTSRPSCASPLAVHDVPIAPVVVTSGVSVLPVEMLVMLGLLVVRTLFRAALQAFVFLGGLEGRLPAFNSIPSDACKSRLAWQQQPNELKWQR